MPTSYLKKISELGRPVKWGDLGVSKTKIKPLVELGLLEYTKILTKSGKLPKNENAVKITRQGLAYLNSLDDTSISVYQEVVELKKVIQENVISIKEIEEEVRSMKENILSLLDTNINQIEKRLISNKLDFDKMEKQIDKINLDAGFKQNKGAITYEMIKDAFYDNKRGLGASVPLKSVITTVMSQSGHTMNYIKKTIGLLYQEGKLDLYEGMGDQNYSINIDQTIYNLIKVD